MRLTANSHWQGNWNLLLEQITRIETAEELEHLLKGVCSPESAQILAFVNAHAMNCAAASDQFAKAIQSADIILRDGSGMAALFRMLSLSPGLNLNGTDLIPRIIRRFDGKKIALFGTQEPYLSNAVMKIRQDIASRSEIVTLNGFLAENTYAELAAEYGPDLVVLGMGMPKQEHVAELLRATLQKPCLLICGGAIIDFLGAKVPRAPLWMRTLGIEWLYRLALEPLRLFRRYVLGNPLFLVRGLRLAWFRD